MKSSVETLEGNKVKVYVEVDEAEFDKDIDAAFKTIAHEVKLPGFRNGKVPRRVLEARIGLGPAREQALRDAIPQYLGKAVREHDVDLVATPDVAITGGQEEGVVEFEAECEIRPVIEVPGYAGLRIELDSPQPSDDDIESAKQDELKAHGALADVDRPAQSGDYLTLDLAATRDGEEVMGLNTEDWSYELGQGWVADDFDSHIEGASVGDTLTFTTTPKGTEESADFTVTVKAIQALELPEPTDEWVSENTGEFDTVEEWENSIRERLVESQLGAVRGQVMGQLTEALVKLVDVDAPESMVQSEMQSQLQNMFRQLQMNGIDPEAWLSATGQGIEQMLEGTRPQAEQAVKSDLALRAVAVAENLDATDADIEMEYARMAMQFGQKAKEIRRAYEQNDAVPELVAQIRKSKAMDWLLHHVEMVDHEGNEIDRDLVLGHTHDEDEDDHDDHDHDHAESDQVDDTESE
ncbi:trigger factor [Ilumatobacter fluminis]|uniref:Trigger factor n=1 Tax=Ilumatobacter fluminis TaxID=467091 RepID=A0A4R7HZK1_9ACTN|nr:trigger factor [Ilumatobacter fluminis]TDT15979.1 trigger factor [Ilumatobacter fluminis]